MEQLIKNEIEKIRRKYSESAEEIVGGYNRERSLSQDYRGRQIYELLQNADDEMDEIDEGRVLISFKKNLLSVSNNGRKFTIEGVKSLLYPNASSKGIRANKIGCKGLGFRSILNWSDSIKVIIAENCCLHFSKENANKFLDDIYTNKTSIKEAVEKLTHDDHPIAVLTCPEILDNESLKSGYTTSIVMECHDDVIEAISSQLKSLELEELIFLPNLKEVEIICEDYHKSFYKVVENDKVMIEETINDKKNVRAWDLYKKSGAISVDNTEKEYDFIIAYDTSGLSNGKYLYSYFRTDVSLCFPALIHGTFDLTSDRNNLLKNSKVNEQLIKELAGFMVETAVEISKKEKVCDYRPLSLVISTKIDSILNDEYKLDSLLRQKIKREKIFPSISNKFISIDDNPKYSDRGFSNILNPDVFLELLKVTDNENIRLFLKNDLKMPFYDYTDFCKKLNDNIEYYNIEKKAKLIRLINEEFKETDKNIFPHLIVDSNGNNICDSSKVYPKPTEENIIKLPEWINIKFINADMEVLLQNEFQGELRRNLVSRLSRYNVDEYSFIRLINGIFSDNNISTYERCSDILNWLWEYYNSDNPQTIDNKNIKVICRDGSIKHAAECYIGSEFGNCIGESLISIYSHDFVSKEHLNVDCNDENKLVSFLEWLGITKYPRKIKKSFQVTDISSFLDTCYPLYVARDNALYKEREFEKDKITNVTLGFFEHLDEILEKADFNSIIGWFLKDNTIKDMIYSETELLSSEAKIQGTPTGKRDLREVTSSYIKSYLRYYLKYSRWISDNDGNKADPLHCCFEEYALKPRVIVPDVKYDFIKKQVGATKKEIDSLLNKIGIADTFQEMDKRVIYGVFYDLPKLDPECKKVRSLYRKVIKNGLPTEEYTTNNPEYEKFIESGKVAVLYEDKKIYVPVKEAKYADKKIFSEELLRSFKMLNVDARSGEEKMRKLFGVVPLKEVDGNVEGQPKHSILEERFREEYRRFIPFIYARRYNIKKINSEVNELMSTVVSLCNEVKIKYEIGEEVKISKLKDYEIVYFRNLKTAYMCIPDKYINITELIHDYHFADSFAELISAIIDINEDKDFFRDLFRETNTIREEKMIAQGDDNLEKLNEARTKLKITSDIKSEFWFIIARLKNLTDNELTPEKIVSLLKLETGIEENIDYGNLSSEDNIVPLKKIFSELDLDLGAYNEITYREINVKQYWIGLLKSKMQSYRNKYLSYCYETLTGKDRCIELYEQYEENYTYFDPEMENSLFVDIDVFFQSKFGVNFAELDKYDDNSVSEKIETEKAKLSENDLNKLEQYDASRRDLHILFGKTSELTEPVNKEQPVSNKNIAMEIDIKTGMDKIIATLPEITIKSVKTKAGNNETSQITPADNKGQTKRIYTERSDSKKQEMGMLGEYLVYNKLKDEYSDVNWVSGNAEKAGIVQKGNDSCGYDIRYKDQKNNVCYVEVKASDNKDIAFYITDNELRFGRNNLKSYEIIYVIFDSNGKPTGEILNLSNPFDLSEGEELYHNSKFLIQNDKYYIKMIRDNVPN